MINNLKNNENLMSEIDEDLLLDEMSYELEEEDIYEINQLDSNERDPENEMNIISMYLNDLKEYKILSKEEEQEYIRRIKEENDEDAKQIMILSNLRLVVSVAKKHLGQGMQLIDLISEGNFGLIKSIEKFEIEKGVRFSTYAVWWIRQSIKKAIINKGRDIRIPTYKYEKISKITRIISNYKLVYGRMPDIKYIANEINEPEEKVNAMINEYKEVVSFSNPVADSLVVEDLVGFEHDIEEDIYKETQLSEIDDLLNKVLNEREYQVIKYRYGLQNTDVQTLKEIGNLLDITRERVRQIEKKALNKLQQYMQGK